MYSQCPECLTRFRVTAAALRAAHGTVRCGRCGIAFDALARLSDTPPDEHEHERGEPLPPTLVPYPATVEAADTAGESAVSEFHFSADDIERVFIDARDWQQRFGGDADRGASARGAEPDASDTPPDEPVEPAIPAAGAPVVLVHEPEAIEDITLEGERIVIEGLPDIDDDLREILRDDELLSAEHGRDDAVRLPGGEPPPPDLDSTDRFEVLRHVPESAYPVLEEDERADARATEESAAQPVAVEPAAEPIPVDVPAAPPAAVIPAPVAGVDHDREPVEPAPQIVPFRLRARSQEAAAALDEAEDDAEAEAGRSQRAALLWGLGALLLAIALAAQVTHHYRQDLVRDARFGPVLRSIYAQLGRPLAPNWDLAAFELRQWGASEAARVADGPMTVRASLRNGADFAQPMPLLRLELEDRFGGTVARRDFQPREWLKDPAQAARLLAPGATTEAELDVAAAGADAVGYRLDVCMRDGSGTVACAQDGSGPQ
jgi:predicted Zn finger-like uncharacterized protein